MKTIYYLFGEAAINFFVNGEFEKIFDADFETFKFVEGETNPNALLRAFSGYENYVVISKEQYNELNSIPTIVEISADQKTLIIDCIEHYKEHLINDSSDTTENQHKIFDLTYAIALLNTKYKVEVELLPQQISTFTADNGIDFQETN